MTKLCGRVVEEAHGLLEIELKENYNICKTCHAHGLCGVAGGQNRIRAKNGCGARKNDLVVLKVDSRKPLKLAFIFYIAPLIVFFTAFLLFGLLGKKALFSYIAAFWAFLLFYVVIFFAGKNRSICEKFLPVAEKKQMDVNWKT